MSNFNNNTQPGWSTEDDKGNTYSPYNQNFAPPPAYTYNGANNPGNQYFANVPPPPPGYPTSSGAGPSYSTYDPNKPPAYSYSQQTPGYQGGYSQPAYDNSQSAPNVTTVHVVETVDPDRSREAARASLFMCLCILGFFTAGIAWLFLWVPLLM